MKILSKTDVMYLKKKLRTCRKTKKSFFFNFFFPMVRDPLVLKWNGKNFFLNFSKFHNFFFKNSCSGTKEILKWTKSWILVTPAIKLRICQTDLGCLGPKRPPPVGIGLKGFDRFAIWETMSAICNGSLFLISLNFWPSKLPGSPKKQNY